MNERQTEKEYYAKHKRNRKKHNESQREYYARHKTDSNYKARKKESSRKSKKRDRQLHPEKYERINAEKREQRKRVKEMIFNHYGNECACCGVSGIFFLSIDHINNDGGSHRKQIGNGTVMYEWIIKNDYPEEFQTLCHNCNVGKHLNHGICPHKELEVIKIES